jgi:peptidoglycan/LPS O-acetylase OafA/YrhL
MVVPHSTHRIGGLDALRALAIVLVIVAHYPKPEGGLAIRVLNFGWIGVDLFFVLSGYLIAGQLFAAVAVGREVSLSAFYIRRFLRTLPNYYVVLAVYGFLPVLLSAIPATPLGKYTIFAQNFGVPAVFSPSWSLCVEEQFYLFFPIVVLLLTRSRWAGLGGSIAAGILIVQITIRSSIWLIWRPDLLPTTQAMDVYMGHLYFPTYCRLDGITLGVGIAALKWFRPRTWERLLQNGNLLLCASGIFLLASVFTLWKRYSFPCSTLGFTFVSLAFALLAMSVLSDTGMLGQREIPGARWVSLYSYSLYLTHSLALDLSAWVAAHFAFEMTSPPGLVLSAATISLLAVLLYHAVEKPFLSLRDRLSNAERLPLAAGNPVPAFQNAVARR